MSKKVSKKLKKDFKSNGKIMSKYKRIIDIKHEKGRPGEDFYVAIDEDGSETIIDFTDIESFKKKLKK